MTTRSFCGLSFLHQHRLLANRNHSPDSMGTNGKYLMSPSLLTVGGLLAPRGTTAFVYGMVGRAALSLRLEVMWVLSIDWHGVRIRGWSSVLVRMGR